MLDHLLSSQSHDTPPDGLTLPQQALWWLKKGNFQIGGAWEKAHEICQTAEGNRPYDLVHALAHLIEGDGANAAYWYRRAGSRQTSDDLAEEWRAIVEELST